MRSCPGSQLSHTNRGQDRHPWWKGWLILGREWVHCVPRHSGWGMRGPCQAMPASDLVLLTSIPAFPILRGFARAECQQPVCFVYVIGSETASGVPGCWRFPDVFLMSWPSAIHVQVSFELLVVTLTLGGKPGNSTSYVHMFILVLKGVYIY